MRATWVRRYLSVVIVTAFGFSVVAIDFGHCADACADCPGQASALFERDDCAAHDHGPLSDTHLEVATDGPEESSACSGASCLCHQHRLPPQAGNSTHFEHSALVALAPLTTYAPGGVQEILHVPKSLV